MMKLLIVVSALVAVGLAKPSGLVAPLVYAKLVPGAPIGLDGRVVDTPEVSYAKAEHAAAHINEKLNLASEAVKSADYVAYAAAPVAAVALTKYTAGGAPIGLDGRVIDTPEVAYAKAEHAAARLNQRIEQSSESLKSADYIAYGAAPTYAAVPTVALTKYTAGGAPIGLDGRVVDTPEVAYAKAEHAAARINEKIEQGHEIVRNSLVSSPLLVSSYEAPVYATGYIQHYY